MIAGLLAANAPQEVIDRVTCDPDEEVQDDCEVWPENWPSVMLFLALGTQWTVSPHGKVIGIHYPSITSAMDLKNISKPRRASMFDDIRLMEETALNVFRERKQ